MSNIQWFNNEMKERKKNSGMFVGVRIPTNLHKFILYVSKLSGMNVANTIIYLNYVCFELMMGQEPIEDYNLQQITKAYIEMRKKENQNKTLMDFPEEGFDIETKKIIVRELRNHPCGNLFEYEEEK